MSEFAQGIVVGWALAALLAAITGPAPWWQLLLTASAFALIECVTNRRRRVRP